MPEAQDPCERRNSFSYSPSESTIPVLYFFRFILRVPEMIGITLQEEADRVPLQALANSLSRYFLSFAPSIIVIIIIWILRNPHLDSPHFLALSLRIISVGFPWLTASVTGSFSLSHKHQTWIMMMILMTAANQQPQTSFCSYAIPKIFLRSICVFRWTRFHERWIIIFLFVHFLIGRYDLFRHNVR